MSVAKPRRERVTVKPNLGGDVSQGKATWGSPGAGRASYVFSVGCRVLPTV
jgi:hypothetical protein